MSPQSQPSPSQRFGEIGQSPWVARLSAAGTLAAMGLMPADARAAVMKVTNRPVTLSTGGGSATVLWDIDGAGGNDFQLYNFDKYMNFSNAGVLNGRGLVIKQTLTQNYTYSQANINVNDRLNLGSLVGPSAVFPGAGNSNNYANVAATGQIGFPFKYDFQLGDNYFGFRFLNGANTYFGFGILNFTVDPGNSNSMIVTISKWAYQDVANTAITVETINDDPEPVPGPIGLAGLAAGAAWTRRLRRRIRQAEAA